jgi:hypothetical protein
MCEYSGKLIAWLDHELPDEEATNVEWHVARCVECRNAVAAYEEVSRYFLCCHEDVMAARPRPHGWRWVTAWGGVAAAAILVAGVLMRSHVEPLSLRPPTGIQAPEMAFEKSHTPVVRVRPSRPAVALPIHQQWSNQDPVIEVVLPADALFPPGAMPSGFSFIADVHFQQ